ncbi:MAG TPA: DUF5985 family protein [Verrucomicrobiae bacterium]|jgi:hypothetical protein|nr:DUF5985 family protein [Verrucomicrobiae bacterium]
MMAQLVYVLCGLTSILCAGLLYRQFHFNRTPLLFWSTGGFVCLAVTNVLLFMDLVVFPKTDLSLARNLVMLAGMLMLIHGLIRQRP